MTSETYYGRRGVTDSGPSTVSGNPFDTATATAEQHSNFQQQWARGPQRRASQELLMQNRCFYCSISQIKISDMNLLQSARSMLHHTGNSQPGYAFSKYERPFASQESPPNILPTTSQQSIAGFGTFTFGAQCPGPPRAVNHGE
jgi:hypothetical protein